MGCPDGAVYQSESEDRVAANVFTIRGVGGES